VSRYSPGIRTGAADRSATADRSPPRRAAWLQQGVCRLPPAVPHAADAVTAPARRTTISSRSRSSRLSSARSSVPLLTTYDHRRPPTAAGARPCCVTGLPRLDKRLRPRCRAPPEGPGSPPRSLRTPDPTSLVGDLPRDATINDGRARLAGRSRRRGQRVSRAHATVSRRRLSVDARVEFRQDSRRMVAATRLDHRARRSRR
jgi:hypothetical protein